MIAYSYFLHFLHSSSWLIRTSFSWMIRFGKCKENVSLVGICTVLKHFTRIFFKISFFSSVIILIYYGFLSEVCFFSSSQGSWGVVIFCHDDEFSSLWLLSCKNVFPLPEVLLWTELNITNVIQETYVSFSIYKKNF